MTFVLVENKGNMDKKAFLLLLGYIGYLFLGAAVFLHLEKSIQVCEAFFVKQFLLKFRSTKII